MRPYARAACDRDGPLSNGSRPLAACLFEAHYALGMLVRPENSADVQAIRTLINTAFQDAPHACGTESGTVDALRFDSALTLSLVAVEGHEIVGHVVFSPVLIASKAAGWFGLGPVAVRRDRRRRGIGGRLISAGLNDLRKRGAGGCVVLGDPAYYARFGFERDPAVSLAGVPAEYFQTLHFQGEHPTGEVSYHPAFSSSRATIRNTPSG